MSHEDYFRPSPCPCLACAGRVQDDGDRADLAALGILAAVAFALLGILAFAGCTVAPRGDTFGETPAQVAAANAAAAPVGFAGAGDNAPALWQLVADLAASAGEWGLVAILAGFALASRPELGAFGLHLALGGGVLLVAAFALPAYGGWAFAGLAGLAAVALFGLWKNRSQPAAAASPLVDSARSLLQSLNPFKPNA